jgi:ParB-like chromosome segregation protein Spo0J
MLMTAMIETAQVSVGRSPARSRRSSRVIVKEAPRGRYQVVEGHDTFLSARRNSVERIACLVRTHDDHDAEDRLAAHLMVGHLTPIEEARLLAEIMRDNDCSQRAMFRRYGIAPTHISKRMALLRLSPDDRELVETGRITVEAALRRARTGARPPQP